MREQQELLRTVEEGDEIIISALEHHSNIVPWQMLRDRLGKDPRGVGEGRAAGARAHDAHRIHHHEKDHRGDRRSDENRQQRARGADGGTEVMPGTYQPANSTSFYSQRATDILGPNVVTNPPGPIPDPFFLPGKNNPYPSLR